ncbi:MAG: GNAT family N-acetyltransferase, partial [Gammaproteobacteria bacterium]|nr:GNAT family N-acetyltransferase [Gammaproteobacteria bacterium]
DLRYLLDSPNLSLYVHAHNKIIHAVLLVADEGQLDETISNDIHYGRRRLKGHHLPQIMSFNLATKAATRLQFKRIVRIAVLPTLQGRGLGSQLLRNFLQQNEDVDFIGAIFGATAEVTRFWTQNVFTPVHLGFKSEARSGAHSVLFLKAISSQAQDMVRPLQSYFQQTLKTMKSSLYRDIDEAVMQQLTSAIPSTTGVSTTGNTLHSFAYGHRSFLESYVLLNAYYSHQLKQDKTAVQAKFNSNQQKLMNVLLNFSDFQTAVTDLALSGKKQFIDELRKLTRFCLEHNY